MLVLYLQLPRQVLPGVLERGFGGPSEPGVLYDVETLRAAADGLEAQRAEQVERVVGRTPPSTHCCSRAGRGHASELWQVSPAGREPPTAMGRAKLSAPATLAALRT